VYSQLRNRGDNLHSFHTGKQYVEATLVFEDIFLVEATSMILHRHHLPHTTLQNAQILTGGEKHETPGVPNGGCNTPKIHPLSPLMVPEKISL